MQQCVPVVVASLVKASQAGTIVPLSPSLLRNSVTQNRNTVFRRTAESESFADKLQNQKFISQLQAGRKHA
jgi:hypothetical protein